MKKHRPGRGILVLLASFGLAAGAAGEGTVEKARAMLFLQGGRDYQVVPENLERWKKSLAGRPDAVFKLFPRLNHLFGEGEGPSTPDEYTAAHKSVAEDVIAEIEAFVKKGGER